MTQGQTGDAGAVDAGRDPRFSLTFAKKKKAFRTPVPLYPLADTHAHINSFWSADPAEVLARAALAGVGALVTLYDPLGDKLTASEFIARLDAAVDGARALLSEAADQGLRPPFATALPAGASGPVDLLSCVRFLAGAHPYGAPEYDDAAEREVLLALEDPRAVGVGEIGLDYHFDADDDVSAAPHDVQMACMARQLALANRRGLPVELHLRNDAGDTLRQAHEDALRVLAREGVPRAGCVLHCFGEDRATMERFLAAGCHIAFGGAATFKRNDAVREAFAACPLDRLVFETDCPYMAPEPVRGIECEPALIPFTVERLVAERTRVTGEDPARIVRAAWENSSRLFF